MKREKFSFPSIQTLVLKNDLKYLDIFTVKWGFILQKLNSK